MSIFHHGRKGSYGVHKEDELSGNDVLEDIKDLHHLVELETHHPPPGIELEKTFEKGGTPPTNLQLEKT